MRLFTFSLLASLVSLSAHAETASAPADAAYIRAATGDITQHGGARRLTGDQTEALKASLRNTTAKNVILLIGDGMGDSEITAARNLAEGAGGFFKGLDALPLTGQYTHYSLDKKTHKPDYVTDSAASATAWATGTKSYNGAIGVDVNGKDQQTLLEIAKAAGKATGNVSTAELQDATPAALMAHVTSRKCYGPEKTSELCASNALEQGGKGSISEQILKTRADVVLGGGAKSFNAGAGIPAGERLAGTQRRYRSRQGQTATRPVCRRQYAGALERAEGEPLWQHRSSAGDLRSQ